MSTFNDDSKKRTATALNKSTPEKPNLKGDWSNFFLLLTLYTIQGFPIGLSIALSTIFQSKNKISYSQQALFSISSWPFILKIIWAPLVDALYVRRIGRRKSWLLPIQLMMGSILLFLARNIDVWLPDTGEPALNELGLIVLFLNILSATQDIVVDGWALTMLKKRNLGYSSTCNSIGVPTGIFFSSVCFVLLVSDEFKNKYASFMTGSGGLMTMSSFLYIWTILVFLVTAIVAIFKKEKQDLKNDYIKCNVIQNYKLLWKILQLPRMKILAIALLTAKVGITATENVSNFKLMDAGVSKDNIMLINSVIYAMKFVLPIFIKNSVNGLKPMNSYLMMTPIKLISCVTYAAIVYYTQNALHDGAGKFEASHYYYLILGLVYLINDMLNFSMMVAMFTFFSRLSDPQFGGTYMTLFNTFLYVGWFLPNSFALKLVDVFTFSRCSNDVQNFCSTLDSISACKQNSGSCRVDVDGYYVTVAICTLFGFVWYGVFNKTIRKYQSLSPSQWKICEKRSTAADVNETSIIDTFN